jgi:hypothetical protein
MMIVIYNRYIFIVEATDVYNQRIILVFRQPFKSYTPFSSIRYKFLNDNKWTPSCGLYYKYITIVNGNSRDIS